MCTECENNVLLYAADELEAQEKKAFEDHLAVCESCNKEHVQYLAEKRSWYADGTFESNPNAKVDSEILRLAAAGKVISVSAPLFSLIVKRVLFGVALLMVGFGGGVYVSSVLYGNQDSRMVNIPDQSQSPKVVVAGQLNPQAADMSNNSPTVDSAQADGQNRVFDSRDASRAARQIVPVAQQK